MSPIITGTYRSETRDSLVGFFFQNRTLDLPLLAFVLGAFVMICGTFSPLQYEITKYSSD